MLEGAHRVKMAVDVDDTVAGGILNEHLGHYARLFGNSRFTGPNVPTIEITPEDIAAAERYGSTFNHPRIIAFREQGTGIIDPESDQEKVFQRARRLIRTSRSVHRALSPIVGASEGIAYLSSSGIENIGYHTVRPPEVETVTRDWLRRNNFPNPDSVTRTDSPKGKVEALIAGFMQPDESGKLPTIVLIDDGIAKLLEAIKVMYQQRPEDPQLRDQIHHLVLVGFGPHGDLEPDLYAFAKQVGLHVLRLPSWSIDDVEHLEKAIFAIAATE